MPRLFLLCMAVAVGGAAALEPLTSAVLMHRMVQVGVSVFSKNVRLMPIEARVTKVLFKKTGSTALSWSRSLGGCSQGFYHNPVKMGKLWKMAMRKFGRLRVYGREKMHCMAHHAVFHLGVTGLEAEDTPLPLMVLQDIIVESFFTS